MTKRMTSMRIDEDVLKKAKEYGINVSAFLEIKLREYIALIEGKQNNLSSSPPPQESQGQNIAEGGIRTPEEQKLHRLSRWA